MDEERFVASTRNAVEENEKQREMILLRTRIPSKFRQVDSGWETEK